MDNPSDYMDIDTELAAQLGGLTTTSRKRQRSDSSPHHTANARGLTLTPIHSTIPQEFCVSNIPLDWEKQKVLYFLRNLTKQAEEICLNLYPSTTGRNQVGILILSGPRDFISTFAPNDHDSLDLIIYIDQNYFLTINRNFCGKTSHNKCDFTELEPSRTKRQDAHKTCETKPTEPEQKGPENETKSTSTPLKLVNMTFRITGIPPGKTDKDIQAILEKDQANFAKVSSKIVVCSGIAGDCQSAIITLSGPEDVVTTFANGGAMITERYLRCDEDNDIKIGSHFRSLTQLN